MIFKISKKRHLNKQLQSIQAKYKVVIYYPNLQIAYAFYKKVLI
jgi:hypothetical protein